MNRSIERFGIPEPRHLKPVRQFSTFGRPEELSFTRFGLPEAQQPSSMVTLHADHGHDDSHGSGGHEDSHESHGATHASDQWMSETTKTVGKGLWSAVTTAGSFLLNRYAVATLVPAVKAAYLATGTLGLAAWATSEVILPAAAALGGYVLGNLKREGSPEELALIQHGSLAAAYLVPPEGKGLALGLNALMSFARGILGGSGGHGH